MPNRTVSERYQTNQRGLLPLNLFAVVSVVLVIALCPNLLKSEEIGNGRIALGSTYDDLPYDDTVSLKLFKHLHLKKLASEQCAAAIKDVQALKSLTISDCVISDSVWRAIALHAPTLKEFVLEDSDLPLTRTGLDCFAQLTLIEKLSAPNVRLLGLGKATVRKRLDHLTSITVMNDPSSGLLDILPIPNLNVYRCDDLFEVTLELLCHAHQLRILEAEYYEIEDLRFGLIGTLDSLRSLRLGGTIHSRPPPDESIKKIGQLKNLEHLSISELPNDFSILADTVTKLPQLKELAIPSTEVTSSGLAKIGTSESLTSVSLEYCYGIEVEGVIALCLEGRIQRLSLHGCEGLPLNVVRLLGATAKLRELIPPHRFSDRPEKSTPAWTRKVFAAVTENKWLTDLRVPRGVSSKELQKLDRLHILESLDLPGIDDIDAEDLAFLTRLPLLKTLTLSETEWIPELGSILAECDALANLCVSWRSENMDPLRKLLDSIPPDRLKKLEVSTQGEMPTSLVKAITRHSALRELSLLSDEGHPLAHIKALGDLNCLEKLSIYMDETESAEAVFKALQLLDQLTHAYFWGFGVPTSAVMIAAEHPTLLSLTVVFSEVDLHDLVNACRKNPSLVFSG